MVERSGSFTATRRGILAGAVGVSSFAIGGRAKAATKEVVIVASPGIQGDSIKKNFFEPFEAATGIKVRSSPMEINDQWARVRAAKMGGKVPFDLLVATPPDLIEHADELAAINCSSPGIADNTLAGSCSPQAVARDFNALVVTWSKKAYPNGGPQSWTDFFDVKKFPGQRTFPDTGDRDWWVPLVALFADGVEPAKAFPMDLDRAYKKLDSIKPNVAAWWKSSDQFMQIAQGGEAVMLMAYASRAIMLAKSGGFDFTYSQGLPVVGYWAVLKGGPNTDEAMQFLDFYYGNPKAHAAISQQVNLSSNNKFMIDLVPENEKRLYASDPDNWPKIVTPDFKWIGANRARLRDRWISWLTA